MGKDDAKDNNGRKSEIRARRATSGESRLWREVTRNVTPIERDVPPSEKEQPVDKRGKKPPTTRKVKAPAPISSEPAPVLPKPRPRPESGIDKRSLDRLRRGKAQIDATLDLHGMRQDEAHRRLNVFVLDCWARGKRVLLIITGKGVRSAEPGGVLRKRLPQWLHDDPLGDKVLTIQPAQPKDGGSGAFYVMLRRRRD